MHFQFDYLCIVETFDIISEFTENFKVHREYLPALRFVFSIQSLTRLVTSFL